LAEKWISYIGLARNGTLGCALCQNWVCSSMFFNVLHVRIGQNRVCFSKIGWAKHTLHACLANTLISYCVLLSWGVSNVHYIGHVRAKCIEMLSESDTYHKSSLTNMKFNIIAMCCHEVIGVKTYKNSSTVQFIN
jgi:hypothetical protein